MFITVFGWFFLTIRSTTAISHNAKRLFFIFLFLLYICLHWVKTILGN